MKLFKKTRNLNSEFFYGVPYKNFLTYFTTVGFFGACEWLVLVGYKVEVISFPLFLKR